MKSEVKVEKMNASQKLEALEQKLMAVEAKLNNAIELLLEKTNRLADTDVALAKRVNAIVKAGEEGGINSETVTNAATKTAADELKARVQMLIDNGVLILDNDSVITEGSFVVGREVDSAGIEINPRVQFAVRAIAKEAQDLVLGKKAGEFIKDEQSQTAMEITEVYSIKEIDVESSEELDSEMAEEVKEEQTTPKKKSKKA